eukprot:1182429-Pyramimonas_sp.AAC.1
MNTKGRIRRAGRGGEDGVVWKGLWVVESTLGVIGTGGPMSYRRCSVEVRNPSEREEYERHLVWCGVVHRMIRGR